MPPDVKFENGVASECQPADCNAIGVCLLVVFLALLTVLFYLDRIRDALLVCGIFAVTNALTTTAGLLAGERWYGTGFTAAAAVGVVVGGVLAGRALSRLEYETFTAQPVYSR